jgi:hypothetical protein
MAKRNDLMKQEELLKKILDLEKKIEEKGKATSAQQNQLNKAYQESFKAKSASYDLEKKINDFNKSALGRAGKKLGIDKQMNNLAALRENGSKKDIKNADKLFDIMEQVSSGTKSFSEALSDIGEGDFGKLQDQAVIFGQLLDNNRGSLEKQIKVGVGIKKGFESISETLLGINVAETLSAAGALAAITSFLGKALEVKQTLGTTAVESARVAGNMTAAGVAARMMGGNAQEAEAAVSAMVDEFGTLNVLSLQTSLSLGALVADTGLTGANAAKLLKSMEAIGTSSIETNMNIISATAELARAEGVAPAQVLNDIAESTETFALFAKDGGDNIAKAAIEARKLGLNLGTVAGIAESLLDFESSIGQEMEASVLLGRQLNLDKARELALSGNLAGLSEEIKNQVGSQAEFEAMNVVQRKALAQAIGVSASDLGKIVAGEKTSAELAEEKNRKEMEFIGLQKLAANAQIVTAIASMFAGNAKFGPLGAGLAAAGVMALYAAISNAPKLETGGVVKETGMAVVHKGEVFSGTRNEMGMGNGQTNKLLRELIEQNEFLMNRLTNRVGDIALSKAV